MIQGFLVGRLGKDAELRSTKDGTAVSNFSIAVNVGRGEREKTLWVDCVLWGGFAEAMTPYLRTGTQVALVGELDVHAWISRQDGDAHASIQCSVSELTLCGSKPKEKPSTNGGTAAAAPAILRGGK